MQRPTDDRYLITMRELKDRMVVLLSGRAAEEVVFGEISTGAADDLVKVTDIARQIVTRFGMTKALGQAVLERTSQTYLGDQMIGVREKDYSEDTAREIDLAVKKLIDEAYERAKALLTLRPRAGTKARSSCSTRRRSPPKTFLRLPSQRSISNQKR